MISFFKDKSPAAVFWLIIACFGLHIYSILNPPQVIITPAEGFFYYMLDPIKNAGAYALSLLYIFIIFIIALQLNFVLNILQMFPKSSYTAALAFILFTALWPAFNVISPALFACIFLIWVLYTGCKLYAAQNAKTAIYNFGMLSGLCAILYYPSIPLVPVTFIILAIMRPFRTNEWFILFFGILTPAYFLTAYLFLTSQLNLIPKPEQLFALIKLPVQPLPVIISLAIAAFTTLWGIFSVQKAGNNVLIQIRQNWTVIFVSLVFITPVLFFVNGAFPAALLLIAIPAAAYTGHAFANNRNILPVVFFWIFIALNIYNNWFAKY